MGFGHSLPLRVVPKASNTLLDSQLDAPHQHMRVRGGEELPVDEPGDQEKTHRYSADNPTTSSNSREKNMTLFL